MKTNRGLITTCEVDNNFSLAPASPAPLLFLDFPPAYLRVPPTTLYPPWQPLSFRLIYACFSFSFSLSFFILFYTHPTLDSDSFRVTILSYSSAFIVHSRSPIFPSSSSILSFVSGLPWPLPSCSSAVLVSRLLAWTTNERPYGAAVGCAD